MKSFVFQLHDYEGIYYHSGINSELQNAMKKVKLMSKIKQHKIKLFQRSLASQNHIFLWS